MEDIKLTLKEQEILASVEKDEWLSVPNLEQEIKHYQRYAEAQLGALEEIKIKIPAQDLQVLETLAQQSETSLQTVIANLLHQFVIHKS